MLNRFDMNLDLKVCNAVIMAVLFLTAQPVFAGEKETPLLVGRYRELFPVLASLEGKVWGEPVPYSRMPVLAYDPAKGEEYLLNYSSAPPAGYAATEFTANGLPAFRKEGEMTLNYGGGQCCRLIGGRPVVTMGYGSGAPAVSLLRLLLHEGFHYFQFSSLYPSGAAAMLDRAKADLFRGIPRNEEYDKLLTAEGRLLYSLVAEGSPGTVDARDLRRLAALDALRRRMLSPEAAFGEDSQLLLEGTAIYAELRGLSALLTKESPAVLPPSISTSAVSAELQLYLRHYGPEMLRNQRNLTTIANGELLYRYAAAFARVLEKSGKKDWDKGLFPLVAGATLARDQAEREAKENLSARAFSSLLAERAGLSGKSAERLWKELEPELLSAEDVSALREKLDIEKHIIDYPYGEGWTYRIEAGRVVYPYFDYLTGRMYIGENGSVAYLSGLQKLMTPEGRLIVEGISSPVVLHMFTGRMRFRGPAGETPGDRLKCEGREGDICGRLELALPGIKLTALKAAVSEDPAARKTTIRLE
jgi:hypothetical protein